MRRTGCHNFWDIQHCCPSQTQRYLPALDRPPFMSPTGRHGRPKLKTIFQPFQVFKVQHNDLNDIARHCKGLPAVALPGSTRLSPGFHPSSARAAYLILPQGHWQFQQYIIKRPEVHGSYAIAVLASHQPPVSSDRQNTENGYLNHLLCGSYRLSPVFLAARGFAAPFFFCSSGSKSKKSPIRTGDRKHMPNIGASHRPII